jgi:hypothetical protein
MNTAISSSVLSLQRQKELMVKLAAAGLDDRLARKVIGSKANILAERVVNRIVEEDSIPQHRALDIMGRNFFGIGSAIKHFCEPLGIKLPERQAHALQAVPFSEAVLESRKNTHVLVVIFPLSILDIGAICSRIDNPILIRMNRQCDMGEFARDTGQIGWQLVRKGSVTNSTSKYLHAQLPLLALDQNEEVPSAQVVIYTVVGHYLATFADGQAERLFERVCVRTNSLNWRICVGPFFGNTVNISWQDAGPYSDIGLSGALKQ